MLPEIWVFGGICVETDEIFIKIVQNRKAETLIPLIESSIMLGSIIVSDYWKSYDGIQYLEIAFQHFTVNHGYNFVDPETGFNTQKCERLWRSLKEFKHRNHGIHRDQVKDGRADCNFCHIDMHCHLHRHHQEQRNAWERAVDFVT